MFNGKLSQSIDLVSRETKLQIPVLKGTENFRSSAVSLEADFAILFVLSLLLGKLLF